MADFHLVIVSGPNEGRDFDVSGSTVIGRDPSSGIVLDDAESSRRHASFHAESDGLRVEDLGSTNGTYLDRAKVSGPTPVPLGVPIRIGRTSLELRP